MAGAPSLTGLSARMAGLRVAPPTARSSVPAARAATVSIVARSGRPGIGVLGKKAGMTQVFTDDGLAVPATVISVADGNVVTAVRTEETSGYNAVQVGYAVVAERKLTKPEAGHLKAAGTPPMRHLVEFKVSGRGRTSFMWPAARHKPAAGGVLSSGASLRACACFILSPRRLSVCADRLTMAWYGEARRPRRARPAAAREHACERRPRRRLRTDHLTLSHFAPILISFSHHHPPPLPSYPTRSRPPRALKPARP